MKTLSFHDLKVGRLAHAPVITTDTSRDGVQFEPGLNLIIAPNGYGKTTLLQSIAGVLPILAGNFKLAGEKLQPEKDVLYVSEYLSFPKFIYPKEWIEFMSEGHNQSAKHSVDQTRWIEGFSLTPKMSSYLGRMSQGERRKVTWLAADASRKPILLLDEPLDGLDLLSIQTARDLMEKWKQEGRIVCVVAHQVGELLDLSTRVFLIRDKKLLTWTQAQGQNLDIKSLSQDEFRRKLIEFYI